MSKFKAIFETKFGKKIESMMHGANTKKMWHIIAMAANQLTT
jgi:hypothetical protein